MTAYCAIDDLAGLVPPADLAGLADDSADGSGTIDTPAVRAILDRACEDASREIDGYCESRYAVPLSPVPGLARTLAARLAVAALFGRRPGGAPEHWLSDQKEARATLKAVAAGTIRLGPKPGETAGPVALIEVKAEPQIFGPDLWEKY
jgi:phage gp36-like protein